jgi:hypothetical protein
MSEECRGLGYVRSTFMEVQSVTLVSGNTVEVAATSSRQAYGSVREIKWLCHPDDAPLVARLVEVVMTWKEPT